jgi:preprotein translocase subunit YajC
MTERNRTVGRGVRMARRISWISLLALVLAATAVAAQTEADHPTTATPSGLPPWMGQLFLIGTFVLIFYFLLLRPQQKKQKQMQSMLKALKRGDRVLTSGGMYGTVLGIKDDVVVLKIADDVKAEFAKSAVTAVTNIAK